MENKQQLNQEGKTDWGKLFMTYQKVQTVALFGLAVVTMNPAIGLAAVGDGVMTAIGDAEYEKNKAKKLHAENHSEMQMNKHPKEEIIYQRQVPTSVAA